MSKPVNPMAIGGFTMGALILLVIGIFMFGGGTLLKADKINYVVFFSSSLNGLEIGAPVKMQGVKIGEVTKIALQLDPKSGKIYKPVVIQIDRSSLTSTGGGELPKEMDREEQLANRDKLVAAGFRARLETQSLLTGLLYVDLDEYPDKPPLFAGLEYQGLLEIPGLPTASDAIFNTAEEVANKLRALPLDEMVQDVVVSLKEIRGLLASEDIKKSKVALTNTLEETEKMIKTLNTNLPALINDTNKTILNTNALVEDSRTMVQDLNKDIKPVLNSADKTLAAATKALNKTQDSMAKVSIAVGDAVGPESALNETLHSLNEAAQSIKNLTDYLERHPESLISGKEH
ncbi:MAG: MlaD family protein [Methylovulum sp.]|nr:MlaD family protein [Methylovulum sp.]